MLHLNKRHTERRLGRCAQFLKKELTRGAKYLITLGFSEIVKQLAKAAVDRMIGSGKVIEVTLLEAEKIEKYKRNIGYSWIH